MRFFRSRRRKGFPSTTGLILLFVFTMALPVFFLLSVSLELAGKDNFKLEERISKELDRLADGFREELAKASEELIRPYLGRDWSAWFDSPETLSDWVLNEGSDFYLFGLDGSILFPLTPPRPDSHEDQSWRAASAGWRGSLETVRSIAEGGDSGETLSELEELRKGNLSPGQRAELLLEEAQILARRGMKREAWDRLDRILIHYSDLVSPAGAPLALVAMESQIDLQGASPESSLLRLGRALFFGCYFPDSRTEDSLWRRVLARADLVEEDLADDLETLRNRRSRLLARAAEIQADFPEFARLVDREGGHYLRISQTGSNSSVSQMLQLVEKQQVENHPLLAVWELNPQLLSTAVESAIEKVRRFHAAAYLRVGTPQGLEWGEWDDSVPVSRSVSLQFPWMGWNLTMGLEHIGEFREQAARQREEAANLVGISAVVLVVGTFLVFRGVRRQVQATKAKSDFVSAVSHELRTPVANIRLYGEMLQMGVPASESQKLEAYDAITSETERLSRLIEGVLNYSKVQQGAKVFRSVETNLVELVESIVDRFQRTNQQDFKASITIEGQPTPVKVDPDALSQALENLLSNAVKYSPDRREALVRVSFGPKRIEIAVQDFGIGLSRKDRKRIFDRFYRVEDELTRRTSGTGLGLTLARDLVRGFGGDLVVKSRLGEGSRFTIQIPRGG